MKLTEITMPYKVLRENHPELSKPRELWINVYKWSFDGPFKTRAEADHMASETPDRRIDCLHMREVMEDN